MKDVRVFSGIDHWSAAAGTGLCVVIGVVVAYAAAPPATSRIVLVIPAIAMAMAFGTRYRLRVSEEGVVWTLVIAWILPVGRLRYLLDAEIDLYQSFEADRPEGVCVRPVGVHGRELESPCFGPSFSQAAIASLWARANEAIYEARSRLPVVSRDLRCQLLAKHAGKVNVRRRNWQGRIREANLLEDVRIGDLLLPSGTILEFDCEGYLDPRREDLLVAATTETALRIPVGIAVPPETRLSIAPSGEVRSLHGPLGPIDLDGFPVDGNAVIGFDERGQVRSFTLGSDFEMAGWLIAAGTTFSTWPKFLDQGPSWYCTLGGALHLPELDLGPGDSATFDKATKKLTQICPRNERRVDGERLMGGVGPIGVHADGRIDRERAHAARLLRR